MGADAARHNDLDAQRPFLLGPAACGPRGHSLAQDIIAQYGGVKQHRCSRSPRLTVTPAGRSYSNVHRLLCDAGVTFRAPGWLHPPPREGQVMGVRERPRFWTAGSPCRFQTSPVGGPAYKALP